jgi:hypothetical protein
MIDEEKYELSLIRRYDVGPTFAIAKIVDKGRYSQFLKNYNLQLTGLEHVLKVHEDGHTHHIMLSELEQHFGNEEQIGIMRYSVWCHIVKNLNLDKELTDELLEWVNRKNAEMVREVLDDPDVRVRRIFDFPDEFNNCAVYKDFTGKVINKLSYVASEIEAAQKSWEKSRALFGVA